MGDFLRLSPWSGGLDHYKNKNKNWPVLCRKRNLVIRFCGCRVFKERRKTVAAFLYFFSLIIVKSLQLRGCRQIAKPRKYCLVCVIVFFGVCFLYFFVSHRLGFRFNSLHSIYYSLSQRLLSANCHTKEFSFMGHSKDPLDIKFKAIEG